MSVSKANASSTKCDISTFPGSYLDAHRDILAEELGVFNPMVFVAAIYTVMVDVQHVFDSPSQHVGLSDDLTRIKLDLANVFQDQFQQIAGLTWVYFSLSLNAPLVTYHKLD